MPPPERRKRYRGTPQSAAEILAHLPLVRDAGRESVIARWDDLLPAALRGHAQPLRWNDTTLWVRVDAPVWAQEVLLAAPQILAAVNAAAGGPRARELRTKVVPPHGGGGAGRRKEG